MIAWREICLAEMGLGPLWHLRDRVESEPCVEKETPLGVDPEPEVVAPRVPAPSSAPERGRAVLMVPSVAAKDSAIREAPIVHRPDVAKMDWDALEAAIDACSACRLRQQRNRSVPGVGDRQADWLFVGEAPGAEEDRRGEPFVGAAGHLLNDILAALGLDRNRGVYIANTVKCRPPGNRNPALDEMAACEPFLRRQIELLRPRLIVALGRPAAHALLQREVSIRTVRGKVFEYQGIPLVVTYHPAYLLRNPADKGKAWEDLCFARRTMAGL